MERRFVPPARAGSSERQPATRAEAFIGKHLSATGADWKSSKLNAVLFINTHCRFCNESMPFYRQLARERRSRRMEDMALLVLSYEKPEEVEKALAREQVAVDRIYRVSSDFGLRSTPALLFIDSDGVVKRGFQGRLDASREREVLQVIRAPSPDP